jgi:APA family basic amino acid/polyamine antiporter
MIYFFMKESNNYAYSIPVTLSLGLNAVIGAGVFAMPMTLIKTSGPAAIISIVLAAACILVIGLVFSRVSFLIPEKGGFYSYSSSWGGKTAGIIASFSYLFGLTLALGVLIKSTSSIIFIYTNGIDISYISYVIIIGIFIATLFASSVARIGQIILLALTILPLIIIGILCYGNFSIKNFHPFMENGITGIFCGIPSVLFSFLGFESISSLARLVKNPQKTIPIATILTIIISAICYISFVGVVIGGLNKKILLSNNVLSEALLYAFPGKTWIVNFINASIVITILGTIYALTISLTELFLNTILIATENRIKISEILSIIVICTGSFFSTILIKNIQNPFSYVVISVIISYILTTIYLLIKPRNRLDLFLGIIGIIGNLVLIGSAFLQLI